jgi:hypothetical protein
LIANVIVYLISFQITGKLQQLVANIDNCLNQRESREGKSYVKAYSSFGYKAISCRFDALEEYYIYNLIQDICNYILRNVSPNTVKSKIGGILNNLSFQNVSNKLKSSLGIQKPIYDKLPDPNLIETTFSLSAHNIKTQIDNALKGITTLADKEYQNITKQIDMFIANSLNTDYSIKLAQGIVNMLIANINAQLQTTQQEIEKINQNIKVMQNTATVAKTEYVKIKDSKLDFKGTKFRKLNDWISALYDLINAEFEAGRLSIISQFYGNVLNYLQQKKNDLNAIENVVNSILNKAVSNSGLALDKIYAGTTSFEQVIQLNQGWINNTYSKICNPNNISGIVSRCFASITYNNMAGWPKVKIDDLFKDLEDFARSIVETVTSNLDIVNYLQSQGALQNELNNFIAVEPSAHWNLEAFARVDPQNRISLLTVYRQHENTVRNIVGGNVAGIIPSEDKSRIALICFKYCVPLIAFREYKDCKEDYDAFEGGESIFHVDYSIFGETVKVDENSID